MVVRCGSGAESKTTRKSDFDMTESVAEAFFMLYADGEVDVDADADGLTATNRGNYGSVWRY